MESFIVGWGKFSPSVLALLSLVKKIKKRLFFFSFAMFIYLVNVCGEMVYLNDAACLSVDLAFKTRIMVLQLFQSAVNA